jgi:hypothetical protein
LTFDGIKDISSALCENKYITELDLSCFYIFKYLGNNIDSSGAKFLSQAISINTTIKCLKLNGINNFYF